MYARVATHYGADAVSSDSVEVPDGARGSLTLVDRRHEKRTTIAWFEGTSRERETYDVNVLQLLRPDDARFARLSIHQGDPMRDVSPSPLVTLEGLVGTLMLIDRESGRGIGIILFDSEHSLRRGDEVVTQSDPGTAGRSRAVEVYDVVELCG